MVAGTGSARGALESVGFPLLTPAKVVEAAWASRRRSRGERTAGHGAGRSPWSVLLLDFCFPTLPCPRARRRRRSAGTPAPAFFREAGSRLLPKPRALRRRAPLSARSWRAAARLFFSPASRRRGQRSSAAVRHRLDQSPARGTGTPVMSSSCRTSTSRTCTPSSLGWPARSTRPRAASHSPCDTTPEERVPYAGLVCDALTTAPT